MLFCFGMIAVMGCVVEPSSKSVDDPDKPKAPRTWFSPGLVTVSNNPKQLAEKMDESIACLKNGKNSLPLNQLNKSTAVLTLGGNSDGFLAGITLFFQPSIKCFYSKKEFTASEIPSADRYIISLHSDGLSNATLPDWILQVLDKIPAASQRILVVFGEMKALKPTELSLFDALIIAPENHPEMQQRTAQKLLGALSITGKITEFQAGFSPGTGLTIPANGRLSFGAPEELGLESQRFEKIDQIAEHGIASGAYPGCQIVVAVRGKVIYRKSFGNYTYDKKAIQVNNNSLYDIASITKIAASTLTAMKLNYENRLKLDEHLGQYIPELTRNTPYSNIVLREMMAHQAGLEPFIPFYKRSLTEGIPTAPWYASLKSGEYSLEVANQLFLRKDYKDSMYARILRNPLKEKKYVYSDLCYYFMQPIFEKITGQSLDQYVKTTFYEAMGLQNITYKPLNFYPKERIAPTEEDQYFRKQLLWGFVHDPGAAMLGGVAGHAGIFSNATDMASIMQLLLNHGSYAGHQFFDEATVREFTQAQFPGNKRGIGFDRPNAKGGGTCDELASQQSFGHSGFTGTLAWADPKNEVVFVFLSNRVHPSQDNWKLRDMGIRTNIQHIVYEIVEEGFKN